jgi:hypothetical protein
MHLDSKDVEAYLERQARKYHKNYESDTAANQVASRLGIAVAVIWELIMDLDPDVRAKHVKKMKVKA